MTHPERPGEPRPPNPDLPVPSGGTDVGSSTEDDSPAEEPTRGWTRRALIGTAVLVGLFASVGLFAAWTVTPGPDEEALARPEDSDVVLAGAVPLSWDPAAIADGASAQVLTQVHEGLTVLDADAQVQPALARSWRLEEGGRRLVFELREGLTFSDGSPMDAEDVRRSWLRVIDPTDLSPLSSLLDDVVGAAAYARGEGGTDDVGLTADGRTLTVEFERPAAYFPAVAATPTLAVVAPRIEALEAGPDDRTTFVSSGAYVPESMVLGELRLRANEAYWAGPPPIDRVTVVTDDGGRSNVDVFEDGAVDWTRITPFDAAWIRYDSKLGPQLRQTDEMSVQYLGFDTTEPPFDDARVRRAVAMAVDWRGLAAIDDPDVRPPTSIVPPGIAARGSGDHLLPYDPEAARDELAAAGYADGMGFPPSSLATYGAGPAEAIAAELERELGIDVAVEWRPFEEHSELLDRDTPAMWTLSWSADYPHAHDFLGLLLRSDSSANIGGWNEPAYDALIDAAAATSDASEQQRLYEDAEVMVREQAPVIPTGYGSSWWLSREGLRGDRISGLGLLRYADLAWAD